MSIVVKKEDFFKMVQLANADSVPEHTALERIADILSVYCDG